MEPTSLDVAYRHCCLPDAFYHGGRNIFARGIAAGPEQPAADKVAHIHFTPGLRHPGYQIHRRAGKRHIAAVRRDRKT